MLPIKNIVSRHRLTIDTAIKKVEYKYTLTQEFIHSRTT